MCFLIGCDSCFFPGGDVEASRKYIPTSKHRVRWGFRWTLSGYQSSSMTLSYRYTQTWKIVSQPSLLLQFGHLVFGVVLWFCCNFFKKKIHPQYFCLRWLHCAHGGPVWGQGVWNLGGLASQAVAYFQMPFDKNTTCQKWLLGVAVLPAAYVELQTSSPVQQIIQSQTNECINKSGKEKLA